MTNLGLSIAQLFLLMLYFCSLTAQSEVGSSVAISIRPPHKAKFSRAEEVRRMCPLLTPRKEQPDPKTRLRRSVLSRLSFSNGDWEEADAQLENGAPPILPFKGLGEFEFPAKIRLGSLWLTDIGGKQGDQVRDISGTLQLMIIDGRSNYRGGRSGSGNGFQVAPGLSFLRIEVEGIYQQAENEDVICMLGCTNRPVGNSSNLEKDCDISVKLHYPIKFNLTSRMIRGAVDSLRSPRGFSAITLSSQITSRVEYEATATELVTTACKGLSASSVPDNAYKASAVEFCVLARSYLSDSLLEIETNFNCNDTKEYCSLIGPFAGYELDSPFFQDYNASRVQILVQNFRSPCSHSRVDGEEELPISFVLRLVPADESKTIARVRSALDGQTIVAEGYWKSGSDTLCMAACKLNYASGQVDVCNARICLHIPLTLSIKRLNIFEGSISSLLPKNDKKAFYPLSFHVGLDYNRNLPYQLSSMLRYNYSKLNEAGAVLTRFEPESSSHKVSWFKFPDLIGEESGHYQSLASDLNLHYPLKKGSGKSPFSFLVFKLVAVDKYLSLLWEQDLPLLSIVNDTIVTETNPEWTHRPQEQRRYLNCSGIMVFSGANSTKFPELKIFTEGFYSPKQGKMYMVGCRSVHAAWQDIKDSSFDLPDGMDCEIEIILSYPTTVAAWLLNPGVKVKVHSRRPDDDPFHFVDINAETSAILYKKQREDIISRNAVEGVLSVLTLSLMVICIISQILYLENHMQSTPYISLLMLGVQAMGYALPLVTSAESLLKRKFNYRGEYFFQEAGWTQLMIYVDKILTLFALLVVLRLFEKVWRERAAVVHQQPSDVVPQERIVVLICLIIHTLGFLSVMVLHSLHSTSEQVTSIIGSPPLDIDLQPVVLNNVSEKSYSWYDIMHLAPVWWKVLQEYSGLVEDLFLLPQIIAFSLWDFTGKPLRPFYYVGLTLLQIVPHVYDYLRVPGLDSFGYPIYANPTFDFYTHAGNILIPALALILALLVYLQQRWKGFLRLPAKFHYQPLTEKNGETELVTNNGRNHLPSIPEDD